MALPTQYAWAANWNVADGSLVTIAADLAPYTIPVMGVTVQPKSGLVNTFPIRSETLDGASRGDGMISASLSFGALPVAAYQYILATYLSSGTIVSTKMTVCLAQYSISAIWQKWNCFMSLSVPFQEFTYDSNFILGLTIQLTDLILIS